MPFNPRDADWAADQAELQDARKEAHEAKKEVARLRGERAAIDEAARASGGDLMTALELVPSHIEERGELEVLRQEVDIDLEALNELRNPTGALLKQDPLESATDIVRANQRERAELQERSARANALLSRIASVLKLDRWDDDGGDKLLGRLQSITQLHAKLNAAVKNYKRELAALPAGAHDRSAILAGIIAALEKALAMPLERPVDDPTQPRRIVFVVGGHELAYTVTPGMTVAQVRASVLEVARATGHPTQLPPEQWLIIDENGKPLPVNKLMRDIELPTNRIVITTPMGYGG